MTGFEYELEYDPGRNLIIGPAARCVSFIATETAMASTLQRSAMGSRLLPGLIRNLAIQAHQSGRSADVEPLKAALSEVEDLAEWTRKLEVDDFALVNNHAAVAIWGAFEAAIEDTVILLLMNEVTAVEAASGKLKKIKLNDKDLMNENEARKAYRSLERVAFQSGPGVQNATDWLLAVFELGRIPEEDFEPVLSEVSALRNSLLHRQGLIDDAVIRAAPSLSDRSGEKIQISREDYMSYYDAVGGFVQGLIGSICQSSYARTSEELANRKGREKPT